MEVAAPTPHEKFVERLDRATAAISDASAEALRSVAECDDRRLWQRDGATSMTSWLAARYGLAWGTAREWVRVAHALRRLPRIAEAYSSGRLSWDQLRPLTRFATAETDAEWAERAPVLRPWTLYREARRHERIRIEEVRDIRRRRFLSLQWDHELPVVYLEGMLPAEEGAAVQTALEHRAEQVVLEDPPESPGEARLADALVELVTGGDSEQAPPPTLVVHADAEVLGDQETEEGPSLAETEGGRRLASESVRRLACDARIDWILESAGRPVGIGRRGRQVPEPIHRILRHRDGHCRFPGCERKRWLNAHHLVHWAHGGATDLDNLVLLCHAHHRLIHEGGWRTSGHPSNDLRFHDPGGRPLRMRPVRETVWAQPP
jgi:hypothetical protein